MGDKELFRSARAEVAELDFVQPARRLDIDLDREGLDGRGRLGAVARALAARTRA